MKPQIMFLLLNLIVFFSPIYSQSSLDFSEWVPPNAVSRWSEVSDCITSNQTFNEVVIIATDSGGYNSNLLPTEYNEKMSDLPTFFMKATFGKFNYNPIILKKDSTHAFMMPKYSLPSFNGGCEHVHLENNIIHVVQQADSIYDFAELDEDQDGYVDVHYTSLGEKSGGIAGAACFYITTNDTLLNGQRIQVVVIKQSRGSNLDKYFAVFYHESGHDFFGFPDMDHNNNAAFNHYGIGGFDVMSCGGFKGVASLYNPWFRHVRGWFTPTTVDTGMTTQYLRDFQSTEKCLLLQNNTLPSGAYPNQKFYISRHIGKNNKFYSTWPFDNPDTGGVMIWHVSNNTVNMFDDYSDWRKLDIAIESAHGKYNWTETSNNVENTYVPNTSSGRDSLNIRKIINGQEVAGPYYGKDKGSASIIYSQNSQKEFTWYTNPNSNYHTNSNSNFEQSIGSGISITDLAFSEDSVSLKVNRTGNYIVNKNITLFTGKYIFDKPMIIDSNCTLTIQPGAEIIFRNNSNLLINGNLVAEGSSSNKITFDFSTNSSEENFTGLNIGNSLSAVWLKHVIVKNAPTGIKVNGNIFPIIENSEIKNCNVGIELNSTYFEPGYWPGFVLYNNNIHDNGIGITANNSSAAIKNNTIYNNEIGVTCSNSMLIFGDVSEYGYNNISDNNTGIYSNASMPVLGMEYYPDFLCKYNSIAASDYYIWADNYSTIPAIYNYWGASEPDTSKFRISNDSWLEYIPFLDGMRIKNPDNRQADIYERSRKQNSYDNTENDAKEKYKTALKYYLSKNNEMGHNICKEIITKSPNSQFANYSLLLLSRYSKSPKEKQEYIAFLNNISRDNSNNILLLNAKLNIIKLENKNVLSKLDDLIRLNQESKDLILILSEKFNYCYYDIKDYKSAREVAKIMNIKFADNSYTKVVNLILNDNKNSLSKTVANNSKFNFDLQNFPNPFNPVTKITFNINENCFVTLKVYDILGRVVKTLINEVKNAGNHSVEFDGSSLSSGTYFYELNAGSTSTSSGQAFREIKKMLLMK